MATNPTKEILQRMMQEQMGGGAPGAEASVGPSPVNPDIDNIAKKMALLKGKPEEKYQIFINLLPQILQAFKDEPRKPLSDIEKNYEVVDNFGQFMAPKRGGY